MFLINKKDKKGTDKMLSMYWFAIILIVSVGIFAMVYLFYSAPYDVRDAETEILSNNIGNCLSQKGSLHPGIFIDGSINNNFNLLRECGLNFQTENEYDWSQEEQFFAEVGIYQIDDLNNPLGVFSKGNMNWKSNCFIKDKKDDSYETLVKCREDRMYVVGENSEQYLINILVGIAKIEKNAKQ